VIGLASGGIGAVAAKAAAAKAGTCLGRNLISGAVGGATDGGISGAMGYMTSGEPITPAGVAKATVGGAIFGAATGTATAAIAKTTGIAKYGCFTADTPILMADDTLKPISQIQVGDQVSSFDPQSGTIVAGTVEETFIHEDVPTLKVTTAVVGDDGTPEALGEFTSTATHPVYVQDRGYVPVSELHNGDRLRTPDGALVEVVTIQATGHTETVYNFTVTGHHNYHITDGTQAILVHNNGACETDVLDKRPPNMSPEGAGRRGAFRAAKRGAKIPVSAQPIAVLPNIGRDEVTVNPGRVYRFKVYDPGDPDAYVDIREDSAGHIYPDGHSQDRGPHFNTPNGDHYDYS
jgi:hypothetical protein